MRQLRKLNRRSFLGRVLGGAALGGGALVAIGGVGAAHPVSDNDPSDAGGAGTSTGHFPYSDTDQGAGSDPAGTPGRLGHFSDSDSGPGADPANHGRRHTDSDAGPGSDPANARRSYTDGDSGPGADPVNRGRRVRRPR